MRPYASTGELRASLRSVTTKYRMHANTPRAHPISPIGALLYRGFSRCRPFATTTGAAPRLHAGNPLQTHLGQEPEKFNAVRAYKCKRSSRNEGDFDLQLPSPQVGRFV